MEGDEIRALRGVLYSVKSNEPISSEEQRKDKYNNVN